MLDFFNGKATKSFSLTTFLSIASLIAASSSNAFAAETGSTTTATATAPTPATATAASGAPTYTLPAGASNTGSSNGGASAAGGSAGMTQLLGAGMNVGFGGYMATKCAGTPQNPMACMIAAQSLMQAMSLFGNSSGSKNAGDAMSGTGSAGGLSYGADGTNGDLSGIYGGNGVNGDNGGAGSGLTPTAVASQIASLQSDLTKTGTSISKDGKTITLPDGRSVPAGTSSAPGDLSSAGFSQGEIDAGMAATKAGQAKIGDKIQAMKVAGDGGGGGGGGGGSGSRGSEGTDYAALMRKLNGANGGKKGSVAGMSKKLGADNIGVAGDDIFEMITRRYKARENVNSFFPK